MNQTQMERVMGRKDSDHESVNDREREQAGWFREFLWNFELAWQLLWDNRVPLSTKLVPLLAALYVVSPIDIIPDYLLGIGQVDDLLLVLIGMRMFISLSPPEVVAQYAKFRPDTGDRGREARGDEPEVVELEPRMPRESWESATLRPSRREAGVIEKKGNKDR